MAYLCGGNTHHRERGRKPLSQARFNAKRGANQGFLPTIDVESDPRFLPQICLLIHGATFFARLLREPQYWPIGVLRGAEARSLASFHGLGGEAALSRRPGWQGRGEWGSPDVGLSPRGARGPHPPA